MSTPRSTANFIMVRCRCGRLLRAKWDQVGTEIVCWDCRASTKVAIPRDRLRLFGQLSRAIADLFGQQRSTWIVGGAGLLTLALIVPYVGLGLGSVLLVVGAALYGDQIQRFEEFDGSSEPTWPRIWRRLTWGRFLACVVFAAGTILPLWVTHAGYHRSPHLSRISLPILALSWTILPVVMALVFSGPGEPGVKLRRRLGFLTAHPLIAVLVLAILPVALIVGEALVGGAMYAKEVLPFVAVDYMPIPGSPEIHNGILYFGTTSFVELPPERFLKIYLSGLRHGYSLVGSIPPSMSVPTSAGLNPGVVWLSAENYYGIRLAVVFVVSLLLILAFAIQARCLGVLTNAQRHRIG